MITAVIVGAIFIFVKHHNFVVLEPFVVSARKYRPQTFKDVVGQQSITNTLTNAIETIIWRRRYFFVAQEVLAKLHVLEY